MRGFDFSSWPAILSTVIGLALFAIIGVGIRFLLMLTIQARQQRMNRQINERLKTLIAAYRTLGGSFTGELTVNPAHLRQQSAPPADDEAGAVMDPVDDPGAASASDRPRRIRDAVEAALADILLLGTADHVRLAGQAATDMAAGRPIHTAKLVISLRQFIRQALDLDPVPDHVTIPLQGPTRPQGSGGGRSPRTEANRERGGGQGGGGGGMGPAGTRSDEPAPPSS